MKTVGFFGGSFDPIHFGHISLCIFLMEKYQLDEILFCPASCSPFKTKNPPVASAEHRLNMLKLVLDLPQFKISTVELERERTSYTIDTIRELGLNNIRLLLSDEAATDLDKWKEAAELKQLAPPLVGPRTWGISSTEIRQRLKKKLYCGHLVPLKTLDYIKENDLYLS